MTIRYIFTLATIFSPILTSTTLGEQFDIAYVNSLLNETVCKEGCLAPEVYLKAHSYLKNSNTFRNFSLLNSINHVNGLEHWKAPQELQDKFPYYLSGYDYDDQPVWNAKSMQVKDTDKKEVSRVFLLGDWEGLDITQIMHLPTMLYVIDMVRTYLDFLVAAVGYAVSINMSYAAEVGLQLIKPVLGGLFGKIEFYGTNKVKWMKALKRILPPESIPTWYGGKPDYKPLQVYG
ncbi:unnamed protein product [Allacma fusca]|uniref:CRAL-TRIO domain-containing protein n=1 Tax=Allacma fusca TaxID=39272 RepID=A0A8J2JDE8_9HEXA|nr:unnamed protein product [Allacma fusca]